MDTKEFNRKKGLVQQIADKHEWHLIATDAKTGRVSYRYDLSMYRIDIYLSKMTVCLLPI